MNETYIGNNNYTFSTIEGKYITRVIQNPHHGVMTRKVWDAVTGAENGWTDGNKTFSTVDDLLQAISMADGSYEVIEDETYIGNNNRRLHQSHGEGCDPRMGANETSR